MNKTIQLNSKNNCQLIQIKKDLIPNYFILTFPKSQGEPSTSEVTEMINLGVKQARKLALKNLNDREAYSILYSGYSSRREKGWHIHIVLLGNRWKKAWLYFVLAGKNLLQAFGLRKDDAPRLD